MRRITNCVYTLFCGRPFFVCRLVLYIHIIFFTVLFEYFMWRRSRRTFFSTAKFSRLGQTIFSYEPRFPGSIYFFARKRKQDDSGNSIKRNCIRVILPVKNHAGRRRHVTILLPSLFRWKSYLKVFGFSMEILFSYIFRCPGRAPAFRSIHLIFGYGKVFSYVGNILNITTPLRDAPARISV